MQTAFDYKKRIMKKQSFSTKSKFSLSVLLAICAWGLQAQIANNTRMKVSKGTVVSFHSEFNNAPLGEMINDGEVHVNHHWSNDGKIGFTDSEQGTTHFNGKAEQILDGDIPSHLVHTHLNNVTFNNSSGGTSFMLASDISVYGNADFQNGIIDSHTYNGMITFEENSSQSNASDKSFVDGKLTKKGNTAFEYPIGDGAFYRPMQQGGLLSSASYVAQYFLQNSDLKYPHTQKEPNILIIDNKEYWEITKQHNADKIVLSLTLNPATTAPYIYDKEAGTSIQIVRWDVQKNQWVVEGGIMDEYQTMVTAEITTDGIFALARVAGGSGGSGEKEDNLIVYNAISANGDGMNDFLKIEGIANFPDNHIEIYNRYGVKVYDARGYNESDRVFRGNAEGKTSFKQGAELQAGTYFYFLKYNNGKKGKKKSGYLYITR